MNYEILTRQQYIDLLVGLISSAEGHRPKATQPEKDQKTTIGYGYTFGRNNNLSLWQAAGIDLSPSDAAFLQEIDSATPAQRNAMALNFGRSLTKAEAVALLKKTYPEYEGPADSLSMPLSAERAAFVSLTYNRGAVFLDRRIPEFFAAIRNGIEPKLGFSFGTMHGGRPLM